MFIHDAAKKAMEKNCYMKREKVWWSDFIKLMPTNTDDCIVIHHQSKPPCRGWEPNAEDLTADDWVLVGAEDGIKSVEPLAEKHKISGITIEI